MPRGKLLWQLYPSYLFIVLVSLTVIAWYASRSFADLYRRHSISDLERRAALLDRHVAGYLAAGDTGTLDALCKELGPGTGTRVTVILPNGAVVADSEEDPAAMANHADRPEFIQALRARAGSSTRFSPTLRKEMMYLAVPIENQGELLGVLRTSMPVVAVGEVVESLSFRIGIALVVVSVLAAAVSFYVSRRITRPLEDMRRAAERFARGDFGRQVPSGGPGEIGALAESLNRMALELQERMSAVIRERNELETVLSSMVEGVLAIDPQERVISLNRAAGQLLQVSPAEAVGRSLEEVVRNTDLQRLAAGALSNDQPVEGEIVLRHRAERFLQVHGTVLRDPKGGKIGAVLVLNDVTRLRSLENVRRDFAASVSHEIRTPATSIKGFVETLMDGAIHRPEEAERFLRIMAEQADRLNAIIEDLLTLSSIEEQAEKVGIAREEALIRDVLESATRICRSKAAEKDITVNLICEEGLRASVNVRLVEQSVVNLLDNAIKYSRPGSVVEVQGTPQESELVIQVRDQGCGIPEEHLPRLFERFYRVDKARSRELGGTGLGLAIVKHIAQAHGGRVGVVSRLGEGSVFTIYIPAAS